MRAVGLATTIALVFSGTPGGAFSQAPFGGGRPEDPCLDARPLAFRAGSTTPDRAALAQLDDAAAWIANGAGRYAFVAAPAEAVEPLAPARVQAVTARLIERGVEPRDVRKTSFAVLERSEKQALEDRAAVVVKTCAGPAPLARDWTQLPEGAGRRGGFGGLLLLGTLFGFWLVGPPEVGRRFWDATER
jgi:hypothetical protein